MQHSAGAKHEFTKKDHVLSEILKLAKGLNDENGKSKQQIVGLLAILFRVVEPIQTLNYIFSDCWHCQQAFLDAIAYLAGCCTQAHKKAA
jgi:hypothetical protein